MLFSSIEFFFLFLPVVLVVYLLVYAIVRWLGRGYSVLNLCLLLFSLLLYGWSESYFILLILISTAIDYLCGLGLARGEAGNRSRGERWILTLSIAGNLSLLAFFKYLNFGLDSVNGVLHRLGFAGPVELPFAEIALPLGISFYTFQSMSYTIDVYRGRVQATRRFIDFACYVTMFPQLVAGPIVRYKDIAQSLIHRTIDVSLFASGIRRLVFGLGKKILIADTLAVPADLIFASESVTPGVAWFGLACYTLQIYFDFSGYSDMAIGLGRMLGFRFQENFLLPYSAQSMREFWRRWHISLSNWFRDYLYIPLGGNRCKSGRVCFNLFVVFFLCGLWHGASWNFVLWGLLHGFFLALERTRFGGILSHCPRIFRHVYTMAVVMAGWVLFRCESLEHAATYTSSLLAWNGSVVSSHWSLYLEPDAVWAFVIGLLLSTPLIRSLTRFYLRASRSKNRKVQALARLSWSATSLVAFATILFACLMQLASTTHRPFLYFRF